MIPGLLIATAWLTLAAHNAGGQTRLGPRDVIEGQTVVTLPDTSHYSAAERAIVRLERRRSAAIASHDTAWLATVYAKDFRTIALNGQRVDRSTLFGFFMRDTPDSRFTIDELAVRQFARDAAIVTGRLRTFASNGSLVGDSRYTHVFVRRGGRWEIIAAQATVVPAS